MERINQAEFHHIFKKSLLHKVKEFVLVIITFFTIIYGVTYLFDITNFSYQWIAYIFTLFLIIYIFSFFKTMLQQKELIKISNKGIWVYNKGFFLWKDIKSMRIDRKDIILSLLDDGDFDDFYIFFKNPDTKTVSTNILGMENRKTLVALADNYIDKNK